MRDRLSHMQSLSEEDPSKDDWNPEDWNPSCHEDDEDDLDHQAVVFDENSTMEAILKESQSLRLEISRICCDVGRLHQQKSRLGKTMRRISGIQRDSNAISSDVKARGEAIYARLQKLGKVREELEESHGVNAAVTRIARAQYVTLSHAFHDAMTEYNAVVVAEQEKCRERFQRQAEILGKEVSGEEVDQMVQEGGWGVFSQDLQPEGRSARWAMCRIKERHKEMVALEARLREVHELFQLMAMMVEEQGLMLNRIETHVVATDEYLGIVNTQFKTAIGYRKKNPCFQMCCGCFPCSK